MAVTPLSEAEIVKGLESLKGWDRVGDKLVKTFKVDTYMAGLALTVTIGTIAEGFGHHPDMALGYKTIKVEFTTHDAGSKLSAKDFQVAAAIDALPYPRS